jgi:hypothetical protein
VNAATLSLAQRSIADTPPRHDRFGIIEPPPSAISRLTSPTMIRPGGRRRMDEASWRNPMVQPDEVRGLPDAAAESRAIRAADEAARRITRLLAAGHTPAELGYPELVPKEIVRREWRAWYSAYKSKTH